MRIHNPLPSNMEAECHKCSKILASFVDPHQAFGPDKFIPPSVLAKAKGLAVLTVFKAGFLGSARYGNGVVVARLPDGNWSAPSAIGTGGAGFGGQIGFELTDFVFILNDSAAVRTFSQMGSLTLGGNVSVAAGPIGRSAEAAGAASLKSVAGIFSYSKTKGFFAGVSLEGSVILERRDANEKLYGRRFTAYQLLNGSVPVPPAAQSLITILNSKTFTGVAVAPTDHVRRRRAPSVSNNNHQSTHQKPPQTRRSYFREGFARSRSQSASRNRSSLDGNSSRPIEGVRNSRFSIDNFYSRQRQPKTNESADDYVYTDNPESEIAPEPNLVLRPATLKPMFPSLSKNEAVALFNFEADQPGDLGFKKGDIITVTQSSGSKNDWWTGINGTQTGIFPANYVEMKG